MCKWNYDVKWEKAPNNRCPNLIRIPQNRTTYKVNAKTHQTRFKKTDYYDSLVDMWTKWYLQYFHADYPRIMIRFEDILYRQEDVIRKIRECIGMDTSKPFIFQSESPKWHGNPTDFITALRKYVTGSKRSRGLNDDDRRYAREKLNAELMEIFRYKHVPSQASAEDLEGPFEGWENPAPDNSVPRGSGKHPLDLLEQKMKKEKLQKGRG